nr:zinc finger CCCH domain-containing protein ZFN-like isoform X1 [Ipomoea batatas]GMC54782.1 zinc finger CCCH domain-containing protein ZFN-like isoform X1 [Ipomoea batatas]
MSPIGLPLRPGEQICIFYSRYGICKFGPSCKFDHPMGVFAYSLSPSPSTDAPAGQFLLGSSSGTGALTLSSEGLVDAGSTNPRRLPSGDNNIETEE